MSKKPKPQAPDPWRTANANMHTMVLAHLARLALLLLAGYFLSRLK